MLNFQIVNFWSWFVVNADRLHSGTHDQSVLIELEQTVCEWGLTWEIGPGFLKENALTISPGGNKRYVEKAKIIIGESPELDNWEFYFAKQPKENWNIVRLVDLNIEINASNWTYVILQYEDDKIELLIKADNMAKFNKETKQLAADLVLINLLGEELRIEKIDFFDIVPDFDTEKGITELRFLPAHLTDERYFK